MMQFVPQHLFLLLLLLLLLLRNIIAAVGQQDVAVVVVVLDEFHEQIMYRVLERLDYFMTEPGLACNRFDTYRLLKYGFPSMQINATDLHQIWNFLYMEYKSHNIELLFGLEDGSFYYLYYPENNIWSGYREPGNSGYIVSVHEERNVTTPTTSSTTTTTTTVSSGATATTAIITPNNENYKHYVSCVNADSGEPENCTMSNGTQYIECINDCELIPCLQQKNQSQQEEQVLPVNQTTVTNETVQEQILCPNYKIMTIGSKDEEEGIVRGYIPFTHFCVDQYGQPEQRPGFVMNDRNKPDQLGNCYAGDGKTLINRTLFGNYASCTATRTGRHSGFNNENNENNENDKNNGNDATTISTSNTTAIGCDDAFTGGFWTPEFDPRYRVWYMATKRFQKPTWTPPFPFFQNAKIGIFYSQPMYDTINITIAKEEEQQQTGTNGTLSSRQDKVFIGVVNVAIFLDRIENFLIEQFSTRTSNVLVSVIEQTLPTNYLVATSVKQCPVTKRVFKDNISVPCDAEISSENLEYIREKCTVVRISINEYNRTNNNNDEDSNNSCFILYKAFEAHTDANFPTSSSVNFKLSNTVGSTAYVAQMKPYTNSGSTGRSTGSSSLDKWNSTTTYDTKVYKQDDNHNESVKANELNWYVFVVIPMPRSTTDSIQMGNPMFGVVVALGCIGFIGCLVLLYKFYSKRTEKAIIFADWKFTCYFLMGCSSLNLSTFTLLGDNTNQTCMLRMWSFNGLFACALSPLFVKVWRMNKMLTSRDFQRSSVNNCQALLYTLPMIGTEFILLVIFSFVDPSRQKEKLGVGNAIGSVGVQEVTCEHDTNAFFITQLVYSACLLFLGCVLAYKTRNLDPKFGEAKQLAFSMYNIAFTGIIIVSIIQLVDLDRVSQIVLQAVGILWASFLCTLSFVLPRLLDADRDRKEEQNLLSLPVDCTDDVDNVGESQQKSDNKDNTNVSNREVDVKKTTDLDSRNQFLPSIPESTLDYEFENEDVGGGRLKKKIFDNPFGESKVEER